MKPLSSKTVGPLPRLLGRESEKSRDKRQPLTKSTILVLATPLPPNRPRLTAVVEPRSGPRPSPRCCPAEQVGGHEGIPLRVTLLSLTLFSSRRHRRCDILDSAQLSPSSPKPSPRGRPRCGRGRQMRMISCHSSFGSKRCVCCPLWPWGARRLIILLAAKRRSAHLTSASKETSSDRTRRHSHPMRTSLLQLRKLRRKRDHPFAASLPHRDTAMGEETSTRHYE